MSFKSIFKIPSTKTPFDNCSFRVLIQSFCINKWKKKSTALNMVKWSNNMWVFPYTLKFYIQSTGIWHIHKYIFFLFPSVLMLAAKMHLVHKHLHFRNSLQRSIQTPPFMIAFSLTDILIISLRLRNYLFLHNPKWSCYWWTKLPIHMRPFI